MRNILITAALVAGLTLATGTPADAAKSWAPCKYEDGSGQARCVWDGRHMGNGEGKSLLIRNGGEDSATYTVVTHKRAHRLAGF